MIILVTSNFLLSLILPSLFLLGLLSADSSCSSPAFPPTTHLSHHDSHPHPFPSLFSPGSSTLSSGNTPSLSVSSRPARRKRVLNPSLVPDARGAFWTMSSSGDTSSCAVALLRKLSRASWISAQKICSSALLTAVCLASNSRKDLWCLWWGHLRRKPDLIRTAIERCALKHALKILPCKCQGGAEAK